MELETTAWPGRGACSFLLKPACLNPRIIPSQAVIGIFTTLSCFVACGADWPQWRGPDRTGIVSSDTGVLQTLPVSPRILWRFDIGGGFSSPVVADGKVVYLDVQGGRETAHALEAKSGKEIWRTDYDEAFADEWGAGPRSTPILDGDRVYVQSVRGEFRCLRLADGATVWRANFERDFGVEFLGNKVREGTARRRGNNGSGVIEGDCVIVPVGSVDGATLVCFDKRSGKVLWRAGNDETAYSSPMIATLAGTRQVVAYTAEALMGADLETGRVLWRVPIRTVARRHAVTPVIVGDDVIVSSHSAGTMCLRVKRTHEGWHAQGVWTNNALRVNVSTPVLLGGYLFAQAPQKKLACVDVRTGTLAWSQSGFAQVYSSMVGIGNTVLVLTDYGELRLVAGDPCKYVELGRAQICGETWSHPAYADGRLYVREGLKSGWKLACLQLSP